MRAAGNRLFLGVRTLKFKALLEIAWEGGETLFGLAVGGKWRFWDWLGGSGAFSDGWGREAGGGARREGGGRQMTKNATMIRVSFFRQLASGLVGVTLLLPAAVFGLIAVKRICFGSKWMYVYLAQQTQWMIGCLVVAVLFNALAQLKVRIVPGRIGPDVELGLRKNWLNTAVVLQGILFLLGLAAYLFVEHLRWEGAGI